MARSKKAKSVVEDHVQFEMDTLKGEGLKQTIQEEVSAMFSFLNEVSLNDFLSAEVIIDFYQRNVINLAIPQEIPQFVTECANKIHRSLDEDDTKLKEILSRELYDRFVRNTLGVESLRNEVISHVVSSTIFSMLITETLYGGIKAFAVSENLVMKNVPGASSLFNLGKGLLNKTTFGLSDNIATHIDDQIKKFVKANIQSQLKNSEQFLVAAFDEKMIQQSGEEIWLKAGTYDTHLIAELIDKDQINALGADVRDFWSDFRQSDLFLTLSTKVIEYFFEKYGVKMIAPLLEDFGVNAEIVINELEESIIPIIENDRVQLYLEQRIRTRLERFYATRK